MLYASNLLNCFDYLNLLQYVLVILQSCMVLDMVRGSHLLDCWRGVFLALPIFLGSALNPWVYGFRNTEIRAAVHKLIEEMLGKMGVSSSHGKLLTLRRHCTIMSPKVLIFTFSHSDFTFTLPYLPT